MTDGAPLENSTHPRVTLEGSGMPARFAVEGVLPQRSFAPSTKEEIGEILREANSREWSIVPFGAGIHQHIGNLIPRYHAALSLEKLNQIPEYEPQDLVVKVESGCRLADLQDRLARDRLYLPIDPDGFEQATVGGIVATNTSGPLRFAQGTIRDYLIGISLVQPDGKWTKFGSRVVKNVTGYDMCKLYIGSFGTLGVLVDFFFKLKPIPPFSKTVAFVLKGLDEARVGLERLIHSPLTPVALELVNPEGTRLFNEQRPWVKDSDHYLFLVRFMDLEKAVDWQVEQLQEMWKELFIQGVSLSSPSEQEQIWRLLREDAPWLKSSGAPKVKLKINCGSSRMVDCIRRLESYGKERSSAVLVKAHAGSGIIRAYYDYDPSPAAIQQLTDHIRAFRIHLRPARGTVILESAPANLKKSIDVWGYEYKDKSLMQSIRNQFDPHKILNPGRYIV